MGRSLPRPAPTAPKNGSLAEALVEAIDAEPDVDFTPDMVHARVKTCGFNANVNTIRSSLARLARTDRIGKSGHGHYRSVRRAASASGLNGANHSEPAPEGGEEVGPTH
mgnify:CR=1 FL=1